jgi:hypothetical protein
MQVHALIKSRARFSRALFSLGLILFSCVIARVNASEIVIANSEGFLGRGVATAAGDRFATRLTTPVAGNIVGVQLFWGSSSGGSAPSQETAIRVFAADGPNFASSTTPQPGTLLSTIESPVLLDLTSTNGAKTPNEFRFLDPETNLVPVNVPLVAGQAFYVELELANAHPYDGNPATPGLWMTVAGPYQPYQNIVHAPDNPALVAFPPDYWHEAGALFGNSSTAFWQIRAIIQPVPEPSTYALAAIGVVALATAKRRNVFRCSRALLFVGLILFSCVRAREVAAETVVADSLSGLNVRMMGTKEGDRFAARLTAPVEGNIVGVQIFWGSTSGTFGATQEAAIRISAADGQDFDGTTIPQPGTVLATIVSPVLVDQQKFGAATTPNEFRFLDPGTDQAPVNVPVLAGQSFYVELETITAYSLSSVDAPGVYGSIVNRPINSYQSIIHAPDNTLLTPSPAYWHEIREVFLSQTSWGIRAIIQPVPEPSTYALAAIGLAAIFAVRRTKALT